MSQSLNAAREYRQRGLAPIPVPTRKKNPNRRNWQNLRLDDSDLPRYFSEPSPNIGILTGTPSGGHVDVDLDAPEAVSIASRLLPPTGMIHGRTGKPDSHWWYVAPGAKTAKFELTEPGETRPTMLVELRADRCQTIVPPSVHPSGERLTWSHYREAASIDAALLKKHVAKVAAAALLARHWPGVGSRDEAAMAVAGMLIRAGWIPTAVDTFVTAVAEAAHDEEWRDRGKGQQTKEKIDAGEQVIGAPSLAKLLRGGEHVVAQARKWLELNRETAENDADDGRDGQEAGGESKRQPTQSALLVAMVDRLGVELFHTPDSVPYAHIPTNAHHETWPLRGSGFKRWLQHQFYSIHEKVPGAQAVTEALGVLEGKALFTGAQHKVWIRVAKHDDALYLDLANDSWQVVRIAASGWEIVNEAPVRFRRADGMLALPLPIAGGKIEDLRPFVNVSKEDWPLLVAWILALFRPEVAMTILQLHGGQGRAKTSTARAIRTLVDPSALPVRSPPREERDLAVAAKNTWVIAYDNISSIQQWLSDAMCRLSTDGGAAYRTNYADDEQTIFRAIRPQIITGIDEVATKGDLLERIVLLTLPEITEDRRQEEEDLWPAFEKAHPDILGALLDAVVGILAKLSTVKLQKKPRMADFARWGVAAETVLGWGEGTFMKAYTRQRDDTDAVAREASPVAGPLLLWWDAWLKTKPDASAWEGMASELLALVEAKADEGLKPDEKPKRPQNWPKTPRGLSSALGQLAPNMLSAGLKISKLAREGTARKWRLEKVAAIPSQPSQPSQPRKEADSVYDGSMTVRYDHNDNRHTDRHHPGTLEFPTNDGHDGHDGHDGTAPTLSDNAAVVEQLRIVRCPVCGRSGDDLRDYGDGLRCIVCDEPAQWGVAS